MVHIGIATLALLPACRHGGAPPVPPAELARRPMEPMALEVTERPVQPVVLARPEAPLHSAPAIWVEDAWDGPGRALILTAPQENGRQDRVLKLLDLDSGRVLFETPWARVDVLPAAGVLVHHGGSMDTPVVLGTGAIDEWLAVKPNGTATNVGIRLLFHRDSSAVWAVMEHEGEVWAGRRPADGGDIELEYRLPWMPEPHLLPLGPDLLAWNREQSFGDAPVDCPHLILPAQGEPRCTTPGVQLPPTSINALGDGWWGLASADGLVSELLHEPSGQRYPLSAAQDCAQGAESAHNIDPPRVLITCPTADGETQLQLWSPEWVAATTWDPAGGAMGNGGTLPVLRLEAQDRTTRHWVDLELGRALETPPLRVPGGWSMMDRPSFALDAFEGPAGLYRLDSAAPILERLGTVDDCAGRLSFSLDAGQVVLQCYDEAILWSEVLMPDGRRYRLGGLAVDAVLDSAVLATNPARRGLGQSAPDVYLLPLP